MRHLASLLCLCASVLAAEPALLVPPVGRELRFEVLAEPNAVPPPGAPRPRPMSELWSTVGVAWDADALHVGVRVRASAPSESDNLDELWKRDSVELFVSSARGDQWQAVASPGVTARQPALRYRLYDQRKPAALKAVPLQAQLAREAFDGGYVLRVALPWRNLGLTAQAGLECRLQVLVHHLDARGELSTLALWPQEGTSGNPQLARLLRLGHAPSAPVVLAAAAGYERLRRTVVHAVATPALLGQRVTVRAGDRLLGSGTLTACDGRAEALVELPLPPRGRPYGTLTVSAGDSTVAVPLADADPLRRQAASRANVAFQPGVFSGDTFPPCDFSEPAQAEDVFGRYRLVTQFYDASGTLVARPTRPGRYGAVVTILGDGSPERRYITLYKLPKPINWRRANLNGSLDLPADAGVAPALLKQESGALGELLKRRLLDGFNRDGDVAIVLAGLSEAQAGAGPARPFARDGRWWHELKRRRGELTPLAKLVQTPVGYDADRTRRWPLLLFLHGSGERGTNLEAVKVHGPPKLRAAGRDLPFVVVSPQCPPNAWWNVWDLKDLVDEVSAKYRLDPRRLYLTGLSMGGFGTWELLAEFPDLFAAAAPCCGGGDPATVGLFKQVPLWVFHGAKDGTVPPELSQQMVDALKAAGAAPKFTVYPEAGHDCWTEAYNQQALYDWLLAQQR